MKWDNILASLLLPALSHATRQSAACARPPLDPTLVAGFGITYAVAMLGHSFWVDRFPRLGARIALALFALTFSACVVARRCFRTLFSLGWILHAIASSALWPIAYRLVNTARRRRVPRTALALWGLQANAGDALGCVWPVLNAVGWTSKDTAGAAAAAVALCVTGVLVAPATDPLLLERESVDVDVTLLVATAASAATKVITYAASNWMPSLGMHYWTFNACSAAGSLAAGVLADVGVPSVRVLVAISILLVALCGSGGALPGAWHQVYFVAAFGSSASIASTAVQICLCTDLASTNRRFGRTTALLDGGATLLAAGAQRFARDNFAAVRVTAACILCLCAVGLSVPPPCRLTRCPHRRTDWCC